jgi:hypothetical protein
VLNSEQGLHMEVEVLPAFIASRGGHQMASRVGRQDEGRRESSARKGSITTPGPPEHWLPSAATLFSPSPPWRVDEEGAELQTPELHQPDWCEFIDEDTGTAPPCHSWHHATMARKRSTASRPMPPAGASDTLRDGTWPTTH